MYTCPRLIQNSGLCGGLSESDRWDQTKEIFRTLSIIFTSKPNEKESRQVYEKLAAPDWLRLLAASELDTWIDERDTMESSSSPPPLARFDLSRDNNSTKFCAETELHLGIRWPKTQNEESYSHFPFYSDRVRELRAYMDSRQPTGLRALWEDRRNSNMFYTFWLVIIFGSLSVFLAVGAWATSIAQTWAQFKSLEARR